MLVSISPTVSAVSSVPVMTQVTTAVMIVAQIRQLTVLAMLRLWLSMDVLVRLNS
jgi:hypothetical protein